MSRNNRITNDKAQKLKAGHTYWRCQIQCDGTVSISEEFLKGSKFTTVSRSMFPENVPESKRKVLYTSLVIGNKAPEKWTRRSYLSSVNPGSSINTFSTRRAAQRWKLEVEAGLHPAAVESAMEHWDFCDSMDNMRDDYDRYDDYDVVKGDFTGIEERAAAYSEPMTLGELLRSKLERDRQYPEESFIGTDKKPLFGDGEKGDYANDDRFALEA